MASGGPCRTRLCGRRGGPLLPLRRGRCLPATAAAAIAAARGCPVTAATPVATIAACCRWRRLGRCCLRNLLGGTTSILRPVAPPFPAAIASASIAATIALPDVGITIANCIGIAVARTAFFNAATILFRPADCAIGAAIALTPAVIAPAAIMPVASTIMFAIPFVAAPRPITAMVVVHGIAPATAIEDVEAIAGIPVILIPAATIAYVVETAAIVAVIITVEGAVRIAAIAVIVISIAIVIIAKADACVVIARRKPHGRGTKCCDPRCQFCTHSRHKTYPNMYPSALFPSWPIRKHGQS